MAEQIEASIDGMIAKLRAGLNAKIDAINATVTDGWTLERVDEACIMFGARPEWPYPCVMVFPGDSKPESDTGGRIEWDHVVTVMGCSAEVDPEGLQRKHLRFERAIRDTLLANRVLNTGGWGLGHLRDRRTRPFQPGEGHYEQATFSEFWVKQQQDV